MKKILLKIVSMFFIFSLSFSCNKNEYINNRDEQKTISDGDAYSIFGLAFAKILSTSEIRSIIKNKALEQTNGDYDVLYTEIKDVTLNNNISIHNYLRKVNPQIDKIVSENPDLTIFIPSFENFTPSSWNTSTEIPLLAIRNKGTQDSIIAYDNLGNEFSFSRHTSPNIPILVLKKNERLTLLTSQLNSNAKIIENANFDRIPSNNSTTTGYTYNDNLSAYVPRNLIYPWINLGYPSRDYIYYGIDTTKNINSGALSSNYSEHIVGIELNSKEVFKKITDWSEGNLEFKIDIKYVSKDGQAREFLSKVIYCNKNDLIHVPQHPTRQPDGSSKIDTSFVIYGNFDPIEIGTWDNYNMGNSWFFHIEEYNPSQEITTTKSIENTFTIGGSGTFEFSLTSLIKLGASAKTDVTEKKTNTITIKSTITSTNLYDALLDYRSPILLGKSQKAYPNESGYSRTYTGLYSLNTGAVRLFVLPLEKGTRQRIFVSKP